MRTLVILLPLVSLGCWAFQPRGDGGPPPILEAGTEAATKAGEVAATTPGTFGWILGGVTAVTVFAYGLYKRRPKP